MSLASGENVHRALRSAGLDACLTIVPEAEPDGCLEALDCDIAVMMLHGDFGEDGKAQTILERRGIAYTGSNPAACALAMDKNACKELFMEKGIPTARWVVADTPDEAEARVRSAELSYPLFVKPNDKGSSVGVGRVDSAAELAAKVAMARGESTRVLIEEMVSGRELTVGWLDGAALPIIELLADGEFYDYRAKYISDATRYICPAEVPDALAREMAEYTLAVADCLGVRDLARIDIMLGDDGPKVLEANALPGFTTHSLLPMAAAAAGISLEQLCLDLVAMAARRGGMV